MFQCFQFSETPAFVRPMKDKVSHEGTTAVLECISSGSPPPTLTWQRDPGTPLKNTKRHFYAKG